MEERIEKEGGGRKEGWKRKRKGREGREGKKRGKRKDTCTSCQHFYITNSLLETGLQNFISHNNFEMC